MPLFFSPFSLQLVLTRFMPFSIYPPTPGRVLSLASPPQVPDVFDRAVLAALTSKRSEVALGCVRACLPACLLACLPLCLCSCPFASLPPPSLG